MKLTEAQLKRIIEEEVQIAIDEGLLDFARGAYGIASAAGSKLAGAARGAAGKFGSAAKGAVKAVGTGLDKGLTGLSTGIKSAAGAATQAASRAVYQGKVSDFEEYLPFLIRSLQSGVASNAYGDNPALQDEYIELLGRVLDALKYNQKEIERMTYMQDRAPKAPSLEVQAEAITEAIIKRITKKR